VSKNLLKERITRKKDVKRQRQKARPDPYLGNREVSPKPFNEVNYLMV